MENQTVCENCGAPIQLLLTSDGAKAFSLDDSRHYCGLTPGAAEAKQAPIRKPRLPILRALTRADFSFVNPAKPKGGRYGCLAVTAFLLIVTAWWIAG
jgi:hypothetical protein